MDKTSANSRVGSFAMLPANPTEKYQKSWNDLLEVIANMQVLLHADATCSKHPVVRKAPTDYPVYLTGGALAFGYRRNSSDFDLYYKFQESPSQTAVESVIDSLRAFIRRTGLPFFILNNATVLMMRPTSARRNPADFTGCALIVRCTEKYRAQMKQSIQDRLKNGLGADFTLTHHDEVIQIALKSAKSFENVLKMYTIIYCCPLMRDKEHSLTVKFEEYPPITRYIVHVSLRDISVRCSLLLRGYLLQDPLARQGALYLKRWSKKCGLSRPAKGLLCSYMIVLMWVYFLLQKGKLTFVPPASIAAHIKSQDIPALFCPPKNVSSVHAALGGLISDFFVFYSQTFDFKTKVVSIRSAAGFDGTVESWRKSIGRTGYFVHIEDPYETGNRASGVEKEQFATVQHSLKAWLRTHQPNLAV